MGKGIKNAGDVFSSFKLAFKAKILIIHVAQEMSVYVYVSDQNLAGRKRQ